MTAIRAAIALLAVMFAPSQLCADALDAQAGKALFKRQWVPAPSSTQASDGLGPLFNGRSCSSCHQGGGGARVVTSASGTQKLAGAVIRLGTSTGTTEPYYGLQLQTNAVPGLKAEAEISFLPKLAIKLLGPPLAAGIAMSTRLAPSLYGRAGLDRVTDAEILSRADPGGKDHDGISGRARVTPEGIGRFGWKAAQATIRGQIAHAFALDLGLSSLQQPFPYGDCTKLESECLALANGESPLTGNREVSAVMIDLVAQYLATLNVATKPDPAAVEIFNKTGCARCHVPELKTGDGGVVPAFTDLLLHDMGKALDDGVGEPGVSSSEWRTAPLKNNTAEAGVRRYLHDGSAATIGEAVDKHGGQAAASREQFDKLSEMDRSRLVQFLNETE